MSYTLTGSANRVRSLDQAPECPDGYYQEVFQPKNTEEVSQLILSLSQRLEPEWLNRGFEAPEMRVRMVLEEALLNAWLHGNRQNPDKSITVRWFYNHGFHLEVKDEGDGFDYENIPDPTHGENLSRSCGRGVFIIRHFADSVSWKDKGRKLVVTLEKDYDPNN